MTITVFFPKGQSHEDTADWLWHHKLPLSSIRCNSIFKGECHCPYFDELWPVEGKWVYERKVELRSQQ